ncbi:sorting nexin-16-like isoform X3 [Penaeus japonicus]|uniref:sorting nexin-16-like isoform X3 n=1 Tax=Penaeus japonicus TaxID=27405 RepID=UPI001C714E58|nr:sorting nexin-16-like isoform X3 [Penaeus japonicus]
MRDKWDYLFSHNLPPIQEDMAVELAPYGPEIPGPVFEAKSGRIVEWDEWVIILEDQAFSKKARNPVSLDMAQRVAISRGMAASRDGSPATSRSNSRFNTPKNSQPSSRYASKEQLVSSNLGSRISNGHEEVVAQQPLDNQESVAETGMMNGNRSSNLLSPVRGGQSSRGWYSSNSNLTSSDSTPSSDQNIDSGQVMDSSPVAGPLDALGFSESEDNRNTCLYRMPIVGYEVLEERSRFTVFKIQVHHQPTGDQWFVFRRYTDFVRLNKKLKLEFPGLRFSLPPKKWFGDNFDPIFLEDRQLGLQAFIDNIIAYTTGHARIREKKCVRDFFCLDDPPGAHDTLEESRAMCQSLEENVSYLQEQLRERDSEIAILRSQVNFLMAQQQTLVKALRLECDLQSTNDHSPGSTHELNLALLNINSEGMPSGRSTPVRRLSKARSTPTVDSPLTRTLEKAFVTGPESQSSLSSGTRVTQEGINDCSGERPADVSQER